jgi:hypothetical protein
LPYLTLQVALTVTDKKTAMRAAHARRKAQAGAVIARRAEVLREKEADTSKRLASYRYSLWLHYYTEYSASSYNFASY